MAIEVRQITVKSVVSATGEERVPSLSSHDEEQLKQEILSECRQMLLELIKAEKER